MRSPVLLPAILGSLALLLSGCAATAPESSGVQVVASTDVYGDLVELVGGDHVSVASIIDSPDKDPHSYEASAQDQLAVSRADLIVMNGGGYDPFMTVLIDASGSSAAVIDAVDVSGIEAEHTDEDADEHGEEDADEHGDEHGDGHGHEHAFNEHVWYDFHAIEDVVEAIADRLIELDAGNAERFEQNADALTAQLELLDERVHGLEPLADGRGAAMTEPVPLYLLEAAGLHDDSPAAFTEATEESADVPPSALQDMLDLMTGDHIAVLAYNSQTASPETERVRAAAESAGIPVVDFTETLPDGQTYLSWMTANVDALEAALQG